MAGKEPVDEAGDRAREAEEQADMDLLRHGRPVHPAEEPGHGAGQKAGCAHMPEEAPRADDLGGERDESRRQDEEGEGQTSEIARSGFEPAVRIVVPIAQ